MRTESLLAAYQKTAEVNRLRMQRLDEVLVDFESSGVQVVPLKGMDLLGRAYDGLMGLRPMVDVDLLFHRTDLPAIERILGVRGFRSRADGNPSYLSHDNVLALDMVSEVWYRQDSEAVWGRLVPRKVAGRSRPSIHPEDSLVYLLAHQTVHRGRLSSSFAQDIAALLEAEEDSIDWHEVLQQIRDCHLQVPVFYGLSYVRDAGCERVPGWVLEALRPAGSQRLTAFFYRRLLSEQGVAELGHLLLVLRHPDFKGTLSALREKLFPSAEFLDLRYGEQTRPRRLWTRISRPVRLLYGGFILLCRAGWRVLRPSDA